MGFSTTPFHLFLVLPSGSCAPRYNSSFRCCPWYWLLPRLFSPLTQYKDKVTPLPDFFSGCTPVARVPLTSPATSVFSFVILEPSLFPAFSLFSSPSRNEVLHVNKFFDVPPCPFTKYPDGRFENFQSLEGPFRENNPVPQVPDLLSHALFFWRPGCHNFTLLPICSSRGFPSSSRAKKKSA